MSMDKSTKGEAMEYPVDASSPHLELENGITTYLKEPELDLNGKVQSRVQPQINVLEVSPEKKVVVVRLLLARMAWTIHRIRHGKVDAYFLDYLGAFQKQKQLFAVLLRNPLPFSDEDVEELVNRQYEFVQEGFEISMEKTLKVCEMVRAVRPLSPGTQRALGQIKKLIARQGQNARMQKWTETIDQLVEGKEPQVLDLQDFWAQAAQKLIASQPAELRGCWKKLLEYCRNSEQSKPSKKWLKGAGELVGQIGASSFRAAVLEWFPLVKPSAKADKMESYVPPMCERNVTVLKGLVWSCTEYADDSVINVLGNLAEISFKKLPNWGALSNKVGNACLFVLESLPGLQPIAALSRLKLKVKYATAQTLIQKALGRAAAKMGISSAELEEIAVPTYGLDEQGRLEEKFGAFIAEVRIAGTQSVELSWRTQGGKPQKSIPAEVKTQHATELKVLKRTVTEIEKMLPAQRERIEKLFVAEREWDFESWRARYLNHPLLANMSRRLIWHFQNGERKASGIWRDGKLVDIDNKQIDWLTPETKVRLWHPIGFDIDTVSKWRKWLEGHEIVQPFKQAHRELYILTDAELATGTYSNRFAAHIIKQHQFAALARQRGWKYSLQGAFDSANTPTLELPQWNLKVEFWVEGVGDNDDISRAGIFLCLSTDQVRFCRPDGEPIALSDVPALVFSEVMRDIDLFVGVCSIGNDPAWRDGGAVDHRTYWGGYSFGELSSIAQTRRDFLLRLLPRLKIAGKCSLSERFLNVQGRFRKYKIHLGSGNILMDPNDQYLCIVPNRAAEGVGEKVFLPFEGDSTLAVILSKAFLLVDDDKIKDPTIVSQIQPR